jgi:hypothetical protein
MKSITFFLIVTILISGFVLWKGELAIAQDLEELEIPKPLGFYESLEKFGVKDAAEIPREEWPPIPAKTNPYSINKQ